MLKIGKNSFVKKLLINIKFRAIWTLNNKCFYRFGGIKSLFIVADDRLTVLIDTVVAVFFFVKFQLCGHRGLWCIAIFFFKSLRNIRNMNQFGLGLRIEIHLRNAFLNRIQNITAWPWKILPIVAFFLLFYNRIGMGKIESRKGQMERGPLVIFRRSKDEWTPVTLILCAWYSKKRPPLRAAFEERAHTVGTKSGHCSLALTLILLLFYCISAFYTYYYSMRHKYIALLHSYLPKHVHFCRSKTLFLSLLFFIFVLIFLSPFFFQSILNQPFLLLPCFCLVILC